MSRKWLPVVPVLVLAAAASGCGGGSASAAAETPAPPAAPVIDVAVVRATTGTVESALEISGTLAAKSRVGIKPKLPGRLERPDRRRPQGVDRPRVHLRGHPDQRDARLRVAGEDRRLDRRSAAMARQQGAVQVERVTLRQLQQLVGELLPVGRGEEGGVPTPRGLRPPG